MVALIISRLRAPDCYSFGAVCKSWSSIPLPKFKKEFPTLVYLKSDGKLINFFSPLLCCSAPEIANSVYKNIITSDTTKFSSDIEDNEHDQCCQKGESDRSHCHEPKTIRFAKHGWLLVSQGKQVVFFLNPITNQRIDLPDLPRSEFFFDGISFSESPTSPNCRVLAIHVQTYWVYPTFIRRGEDSWTSDPIHIESGFVPSYTSPVFHKGCFYFLGQPGCLAVFDPKEEEEEELDKWAVLDSPGNPCTSSPISNCYLVDCNGELMSVFVGYMGQWVRVYMLDPSSMAWKETKDLGGRVLFLSQVGSGLTKTTVSKHKYASTKKQYCFKIKTCEALTWRIKTDVASSTSMVQIMPYKGGITRKKLSSVFAPAELMVIQSFPCSRYNRQHTIIASSLLPSLAVRKKNREL
ncbi:hypothetical protein NC653_029690 [Populus alba x Populus x berolinensis]|uniref:KIB1-4 beta-propeller domain-containing protein n=1 Tax=Populus alba x Populus x berolinensis TaxID=444605 RepID=A0AAD6Q5H9_9ROSI|nr:hypothetical protein NC653_029690 [Populus alba x Populus x berolinensis]